MKTANLLSETKDKLLWSNAEPLLKEIIEVLKARNIALTDIEKVTVLKVINSTYFRTAVQIMIEDMNSISKDVDAVSVLLHTVGIIMFYIYTSYGMNPTVNKAHEDTPEDTPENILEKIENTIENIVNTSKNDDTLIEFTLSGEPEEELTDGLCRNDQRTQANMKKFLQKADEESRSHFILVIAGVYSFVMPKELTEKLCALSFFKYLFPLFSNEKIFNLLNLWRKRTNGKNEQTGATIRVSINFTEKSVQNQNYQRK